MAKNNYLAKVAADRQAFLQAGTETGRQQIIDMMVLALRDPEIMGKDTLGSERLIKVITGISKYIDLYSEAWTGSQDADYYQSKLDENLAKAFGNGLKDSFFDRYKYIKEFDYKRVKKLANLKC